MATKKPVAAKKKLPKSRRPTATTIPTRSAAPAATTAPTEEDWERVIHQFKLFDDLENEDLRRRAKTLPKLLEREADAIYRILNHFMRTSALPDGTDLAFYSSDVIAERLIGRGWLRGDPFGAWVHEVLLGALKKRVTRSANVLREQADTLQFASEAVQRIMTLYEESLETIRIAPRGRYPSVAMFWLIRSTDRWGSSISQIARQLIKYDAESWSDNDDLDPMERWTAILKKGRARARRRGSGEDD